MLENNVLKEMESYERIADIYFLIESNPDVVKMLPQLNSILDDLQDRTFAFKNIDEHRTNVATCLAAHIEETHHISLLGKSILLNHVIKHPIFDHLNVVSYAASSMLGMFGMKQMHLSHPQMILDVARTRVDALWKIEQESVVNSLRY